MNLSFLGKGTPITRYGNMVTLWTSEGCGTGYDLVDNESLDLHYEYKNLFLWTAYSREGVGTTYVFQSSLQKRLAMVIAGLKGIRIGPAKSAALLQYHGDDALLLIRYKKDHDLAHGVKGVSKDTAWHICNELKDRIEEIAVIEGLGTLSPAGVENRVRQIVKQIKPDYQVSSEMLDEVIQENPDKEPGELVSLLFASMFG